MKNVLVIGGDSYIARNFINKLKSEYNIKSFSRYPTSYKNEIVINDFFLINEKEFENIDVVFNFAAIVHQADKNWGLYKTINIDLPLKLAKTAKMKGVELYVQMSTTSVFGEPVHISSNLEYNPRNYYGKSKMICDNELINLNDNVFKVALVRAPIVYGENAPGNFLKLYRLSQLGVPLPFKKVDNQRDFIYIGNLMVFFKRLLETRTDTLIYYPTDQDPISLDELFKLFQLYSEKKIRLFKLPGVLFKVLKKIKYSIYQKLFESKTMFIQPELEKIGYKPEYSIAEAVKLTLKNKI